MQCYIDIQLTSENIHLIYSWSRLETRKFIAQSVGCGVLRARNMLSSSLPLVKVNIPGRLAAMTRSLHDKAF
jgi:hypothetical protein